MIKKAQRNHVSLRPHFKTHQSNDIGSLFRDRGINSITVSSVAMAEYFIRNGWSDVTVAFPVYPGVTEQLNALSSRCKLNIIFSSMQNMLASINRLTGKIGVFIEINIGHYRSGTASSNTREIALMVNHISRYPNLTFRGFLAHAGHTYTAGSAENIRKIYNSSVSDLIKLKSFWKSSYPDIILSWGDTPSCSLVEELWGIDEIRPGNFVFFDVMQHRIGSCEITDVALALISPVVDVYPESGKMIIHAGAVHLSKEYLTDSSGDSYYGLVCPTDGTTWGNPIEGAVVGKLSQEHGTVTFTDKSAIAFKPGDLIAILPIHSCLTFDTMGAAIATDGTPISSFRTRSPL